MSSANVVLESAVRLRAEIEPQNRRDAVAETLGSLIASGILSVDDTLPGERELALALGVSRESVRGGVRILAERGLLRIAHGARTRVVADEVPEALSTDRALGLINGYALEDVHATRMLIERPVVGDAAERMTDAVLAVLDCSLNRQRRVLDDPVQFLIVDREFHLAIYQACGNAVLADLVSHLYAYMMKHRRRAMALPGATARSLAEHEAIMAGLRARDRAATIQTFQTHIEHIYATTRAILASEAP